MELPALPYDDEDIANVSATPYSQGDKWAVKVHRDGEWPGRSILTGLDRDTAVAIAVALRQRIHPIRRLMGCDVKSLAV